MVVLERSQPKMVVLERSQAKMTMLERFQAKMIVSEIPQLTSPAIFLEQWTSDFSSQ